MAALMRWRDLIVEAYRMAYGQESHPRFEPGAPPERLERAERALGQQLPEELRSLLSEFDGIMTMLEVEGRLIETGWLMWPLDAIVGHRSTQGHEPFDPPDTWLVFASALVDGILFAYDRRETVPSIWAWYPMERRRKLLGPSLADFIRGWIAGDVTV